MSGDALHGLLATGGVVVLDGGLASELETRGADLTDRLWSARLLADDPELIRKVHVDYFAAGADVAISASYQASFEGFAARGIDRASAAVLMRRSVELACSAADEHRERHPNAPMPWVAASVGPYGAVLADGSEYVGSYALSSRQLRAFHHPRLEALLEAEPDVLAVETIPSLQEADTIVGLLEEYPDARAWISFSCRDGERISDGTPFVDAIRLASSSPQVVATGVNCTHPRHVDELLARARAVTTLPLVAYPNRGADWNAMTRTWQSGSTPQGALGPAAIAWRDSGASIIGGCCGTRPADIEAIARAVRPPS